VNARTARASAGLVSLLFVLSGATGLAYEVLWFKRFSHVWGSSSLAMASVVASFLAGLGLGAAWIGRRADRIERPLAAYALCEAGIGLCALALSFAIPQLLGAESAWYALLQDRPLLHTFARCAATFAVLVLPCALMGATLPLLVRFLTGSGVSLGRSTAWLYAFNTLGAALGAWVCGFFLLAKLGLEGSNVAAALSSLAIAAIAFLLDRAQRSSPAPGQVVESGPLLPHVEPAPLEDACPLGALRAAALASGLGALLLQMVWGRELATLLGPTTYAFTAMLCVFIAGLGLGSLLFLALVRDTTSLRRWIAVWVVVLVAATIAGRMASPRLALLVGALKVERRSLGFNAALCGGVSAALQLVPTLAMGALFPALVQLTRAGFARAASTVGGIYAWNTAGAIAGALLALPLFLPRLGSAGVTTLALGLYALVALLVLPPRIAERRQVELALLVLTAALILAPWRDRDPRETNLGLYLYENSILSGAQGQQSVKLLFEEGASSNVLVLEQDQLLENGRPIGPPRPRSLRVDGKVDGSNFADMPMQLGLAYFPAFLRPRAERVLVIGMGTGTTVGAALQLPRAQVTCCEIEPAVLEGARHFADVNHDPFSSERFHPVIDDGRNFLQATERGFDLILSEPSNPWIVGVSNLFTREFYQAARSHLPQDGVLAQWIQAYALSSEQYALIVRTALEVFPHCGLLRIDAYDTVLLASSSPLLPPSERLVEAQALVDANPILQADLREHFLSADVRTLLLVTYALDREGLQGLVQAAGGEGVHTDVNLRLEFEAPLFLFGGRPSDRPTPADLILAWMRPAAMQKAILGWGWSPPQLEGLRALSNLFASKNLHRQAAQVVEIALAWEPEDPEFLADHLLYAAPTTDEEFRRDVEHLISRSPAQAWRVGKAFAQTNLDQARARVILEALREQLPNSATLWTSLAVVYANLGREDDSKAALEHARGLDPFNDLTREMEAATKSH
jgi:spermidine synthase